MNHMNKKLSVLYVKDCHHIILISLSLNKTSIKPFCQLLVYVNFFVNFKNNSYYI